MYSNKKAYPYPEIVTGEQWHVMETTDDKLPSTDNLNKHMTVPMDRECEMCGVNHGRMIRRHELGHAKWSPKTMGKLMRGTRADCIEALEEVRINYLLGKKAELPIDDFVMCEDELKAKVFKLIYTGSVADIILYTLASYSNDINRDSYSGLTNSKQFDLVLNLFRIAKEGNELSDLRKAEIAFAIDTARSFIANLVRHKWNQIPSYRKVQKHAEKLSVIINEFIDKPNPDEVRKQEQPSQGQGEDECTNNTSSGEECSEDELCQECVDKAEQESGASIGPDTVGDLERRMRKELIEKMNYTSGTGIGRWGDMTVHTPALTVNLKGRLKNQRDYRPADFGYNPKYINRYCVDKKIFKQKLNVKGGTILIDASGSMSFSGQDILEIMQMLPAVNIAMYNGRSVTGDLRLIARNGMRVTEEQLSSWSGGGNVVDGPALEWLSTMPARRIWVSDMYVFGAGANSNGFNLLKECYDLCTKHKIINLKDIEEVKEYALKLNQVL